MSYRASVLKESQKHNAPQNPNPANAWSIEVKHISTSNSLDRAAPTKSHTIQASVEDSASHSMDQPTRPISSTYFASPIRTLSESIKDPARECISTHDLVEAYNVLFFRIRVHIHENFTRKRPLSFPTIFEEHSPHIAECVSRDVRSVFPNPFASLFHVNHSMRLSHYSNYSQEEEDIKTAMDNDTLCHYALRLLSSIFTFPALHSTFSDVQLCSLFRDVLRLCTTTSSPIFNSEKLCCIVLCTLKTQQLPPSIMNSETPLLVSALRNALVCDVGGTRGKHDAFKAIHFILKRNPGLLHPFTELLPTVLDCLNSEALEDRLQAVFALNGFAMVKLNGAVTTSFPQNQVAEIVQDYINVQSSRRKSATPETLLPSMFSAAIANNPSWEEKGPSFALSLASTLLVLLDYHIFTSPSSLKLVFSVLAKAGGHKRRNIAEAQPEVWKILIWAFSRMPRRITGENNIQADPTSLKDTRERAYRVVSQELKHGLGISLVKVLLQSNSALENDRRNSADVANALTIIDTMLNAGDEADMHNGTLLLERLIRTQSTLRSKEADQNTPFALKLVDGSLLGQISRKLYVPLTAIPVKDIPSLSEADVLDHWDDLSKVWVSIVQRSLIDTSADPPSNITQIWQALLLAQAQSHSHRTASLAFASRATNIIIRISTPLETSLAQARYLQTISNLWVVLKNVFATSCLSSPAEKILASLLKKPFSLSDHRVKDLWSQLCADLVSLGIPSLLHVLHRRSESQEGVEVTRQLWFVLAKNGLCDREDWVHMLHFLVMPFGAWDLNDVEFEIWEVILFRAIDSSTKASHCHDVISALIALLGEKKLPLLKRVPKVLRCLVIYLVSIPYSKAVCDFLSVVDDILVSSYCPVFEKKMYGLEVLRAIGTLIVRTSESDIMGLFSTMQSSLCKWISDEESLLTDEEHNEMIRTVYATILDKLALIEPSLTLLHALATFIYSVFLRVRADGLLAFQKFWRATYHRRTDILKKDYPLPIKACLKAWGDVCDDSFADDVSLGSESQSLKSYTIPDSQPPPLKDTDKVHLSTSCERSFNACAPFKQEIDFSGSDGTVTPVSKKPAIVTESGDILHSMFDELVVPQEHRIRCGSSGSERFFSKDVGHEYAGSSRMASLSKRPAEMEEPHTPKRRRTEPDFIPRAGKERAWDECIPPHSNYQLLNHYAQMSSSEPVMRTYSMSLSLPHATSQPSTRPIRRRDETPSWLGSDLRDLRDHDEEGRNEEECSGSRRPMESSDDIDTWEQGLLSEDIKEMQQDADYQTHVRRRKDDARQRTTLPSGDPLRSSLGEYSSRSRRRGRSHTAPALYIASESKSIPIPRPGHRLRRSQTSPLEHKKSISAQLDALQMAYAIITDTGTSQVNFEDILHARRVANQINQVLDEQIRSKVGVGKGDGLLLNDS